MNPAFLHRARNGTLNATATAKSLTEKQAECLLYWPNGYFSENTRKSLRKRKLVNGNSLTDDGLRVVEVLNQRKGWG
jgi:hypothetical protein